MKNTLIVYSGGFDSTALLHIHKDRIGLAVSFNYGSRHNEREIKLAKLNCSKLGIEHRVIDIQAAFTDIKSALTNKSESIPHGHYESETMKSTVVPFRNGIMLSIAAGIAESYGLENIMLASHKGDHAVYPDCTNTFNVFMSQAIYWGTDCKVVLLAPFENLTKRDIAVKGIEAGVVARDTYSCYEGGEVHCGRCSTCVERQWSLVGLPDDTEYLCTEYWKEVMNESK